MDNQWKEEICGTCNFVTEWVDRNVGVCKKNPPTLRIGGFEESFYPTVSKTKDACSCWREKL